MRNVSAVYGGNWSSTTDIAQQIRRPQSNPKSFELYHDKQLVKASIANNSLTYDTAKARTYYLREKQVIRKLRLQMRSALVQGVASMQDIRSFFPGATTKKTTGEKQEKKEKEVPKKESSVGKKTESKGKEKTDRKRSTSKDASKRKKEERKSGQIKFDEEEVIEIDDNSRDFEDTREKKKKVGEDKKNEDKKKVPQDRVKTDDSKKVDERTPNEKKRKKRSIDENGNEGESGPSPESNKKKKRKKQISSDEEFDTEEVIKPSRKRSKKGRQVIGDSSEEEEEAQETAKKSQKKGRKRAKKTIDSDEEEAKPTMLDTFLKTPSPHKAKSAQSLKKSDSTEKRKTVSITDFFGSGTIHRSDRKMVATPTPKSAEVKQEPNKESGKSGDSKILETDDIEMHSDDDFEKTLLQLDTDRPVTKNEDAPSLASKLAGKARKLLGSEGTPDRGSEKKSTVIVPDTPVTKKSPVKHPSPGKKHSPPKKSRVEFTPAKTTPPKISPPSTKTSPSKAEKVSPARPSPSKTQSFSRKTSPEKKDTESPAVEKKSGYRAYLHREGPRALGSKEIPQGQENCLEGLTFVITGVLESLERDEAKHLIERYGGKVTTTVSKKTNYLLAGRDSGESKLQKARSFGTKQIDEDGLFDLIRTRPGKKSKYQVQAEETIKRENSMSKPAKLESFKRESASISTKLSSQPSSQESSSSQSESTRKSGDQSEESLLWVDKYKPTSLKHVIGQSGDKSNAKKLLHWLTHWHKNQAAGVKPQGKFFGKGSDDGAGFKAALLSGPPGIGKTTTATLVCKEAGFSYVELNASDTRSKKMLKEQVSQALGNETLVDYFGESSSANRGHKHCLIMDEVDGMAGNEDRGGLQELVQLIKNTKIPIITMCNDRNNPKMRTLSNYCFDLRFQKPRVEQIKSAMMTLAYREGLKIPAPALNEIILGANQDIRQVIHNLSMWTAADKAMTYDQARSDAQQAKKDFKLGPFDVCRKVFVSGEETAGMTLNDKSDLFFHDYNIAPLFVQENYIHVLPYKAKGVPTKHLSLLARTAHSLCDGDLVERRIRTQQSWSLLPMQAMYSSVVPGEFMRGSFPQMVNFPSWLGKNSSTNKTERILQELRTHMRLQISGDKRSLNMDYLPFLRRTLTDPLIQRDTDGVQEVIEKMDDYDIVKEDFDNIMEVTKWPNSVDPMSRIDSKTKAAFTRTYNKQSHMTPYATGVTAKKKRGGAKSVADDEAFLTEEGEEGAVQAASDSEDNDEDDIERDTMIKKKTAKTSTSSSKGGGNPKGKGQGKGRGKGKR